MATAFIAAGSQESLQGSRAESVDIPAQGSSMTTDSLSQTSNEGATATRQLGIVQKEIHSESFPENLLNKLNQMRHSSDTPWCDVKLRCRSNEVIRAHGCVLASNCDLRADCDGVVDIDLDRKLVAPLIDYCYTGRLILTTQNIADLFKAAEALKLNKEVQKMMEAFLVENLRIVANQIELVTQLSEESIRRALTDPRRVKKMPIWCYVLFNWWRGDTARRTEAFIDFMKVFEPGDLDACIQPLENSIRAAAAMFSFGPFNTSIQTSADNSTPPLGQDQGQQTAGAVKTATTTGEASPFAFHSPGREAVPLNISLGSGGSLFGLPKEQFTFGGTPPKDLFGPSSSHFVLKAKLRDRKSSGFN